jgi:hypothetical protein
MFSLSDRKVNSGHHDEIRLREADATSGLARALAPDGATRRRSFGFTLPREGCLGDLLNDCQPGSIVPSVPSRKCSPAPRDTSAEQDFSASQLQQRGSYPRRSPARLSVRTVSDANPRKK